MQEQTIEIYSLDRPAHYIVLYGISVIPLATLVGTLGFAIIAMHTKRTAY